MTYDTMNPVPSTDPRDLDDNAQAFDRFLQSDAAAEPDRLGVARKTYKQMERDAEALVAPNVAALAAVTAAADKGVFFNAAGPVGMGTYTLNAFNRSLGATADQPGFRAAIGAMALGDTGAYSGSAASLTNSRSISISGDANWAVSFNGSANVTAALTLNTVPVNKGGTGGTTKAAAGTNLGVSAVGTNTSELAQSAMVQAEINNKRAWTSYTPTLTAASGTFTSISATGKHMAAFGICHFQVVITVTTKGTGVKPIFTLPFPALAGSANLPLPGREGVVNGKWGGARITAGLLTAQCTDYADGDLATADGCVITINGYYPIA